MSTLRFNPFGQIHKGLRALLYDTGILLQHTNFTDAAEKRAAIERVQLVNTLFAHHADVEDNHIFPLIEAYAPQVVDEFEAQHQRDHALSQSLDECLTRLAGSNTPGDVSWAGNELMQSFHAFLAFNVEHMKQEETVVNACLWQYYTDAELVKKVQDISNSIPPAENQHFIYWMLKGMATHEIITWLTAIKRSAPEPVLEFFFQLAETALPAPRWTLIQSAVVEDFAFLPESV